MKRAEEIQANLAPEFPSIIRYMLRSHVTGGFWLGLPKKFCSSHLPRQDTTVILEDECGKKYKVVYLAAKNFLSGGWKGFSIAHNLLEEDAIVFHLVEHSKFKVYIVTRNGLDEVDGALGLLKMDASVKQMEDENGKRLPLNKCLVQKGNIKNDCLDNKLKLKCENESDDAEVVDGIRLAETVVEFKQVKGIGDFKIHKRLGHKF